MIIVAVNWFCWIGWVEIVVGEFVGDTIVVDLMFVGKFVGMPFVVGTDVAVREEVVGDWVVTIGIGANFAIPFTNVLLIVLNDPPT